MRVCLVTAMHPCHHPRLLREADMLAEAGHDVRVVAPCVTPWLIKKDEALLLRRKWRLQQVVLTGRAARISSRLRRIAAAGMWSLTRSSARAEEAYTPALGKLRSLAAREPADWFIAHTQAALAPAAKAARRWKARLGFDCEDLLARADGEPHDLIRAVEGEYIGRCDYVSCASQCMADCLTAEYGVRPEVLYNVFPLALARGMTPPARRAARDGLRLLWFGQTIGPGRGVEEAVEALAQLPANVELYLRGYLRPEFHAKLEREMARHRVAGRVHFLPPLEHDDLIASFGGFDVGLALERPEHGNYSLTVTNKVFSYLLAGLAIAATDTLGQREIMPEVAGAGFLYPAGDAHALANFLREWAADAAKLRVAQQAAWQAARDRFCWELESEKFLELLAPAQQRAPALAAAEAR